MSEHLAEHILYAPETGYVTLDVPMLAELPETWDHDGRNFTRKPELHVSLLDAHAVALSQHISEPKLIDAARVAFDRAPVAFRRFSPPLYECQKDGGKSLSIIAPVEVIGLNAAFEALALRALCNLKLPLTHVTLYTAGDPKGIAVKDSIMLAVRCQRMDAPDLAAMVFDEPAA
ncbi:MAG: hypothetical protein ABIR37_03360 [Candidatus Saccharimonadales bacterium]